MMRILKEPNYQCALGVWFMVAGSAGYERYMLEGDIAGAIFDGAMQILGVVLFKRSLDKMRGQP